MLAYLRAKALSAGFLGGSRFWIGLGAIVWTIRLCQWLVRPDTEVIYREKLGTGKSVIIRHNDPAPKKRQRKKLAKIEKAQAKSAKRGSRSSSNSHKPALSP